MTTIRVAEIPGAPVVEPPMVVAGAVRKLPSGLSTRTVVCVPGLRLVLSQVNTFPAVEVGSGTIEE